MNYHLRPRSITYVFRTLALKYALRLTAGLACLLWLGVPSLRAADRYVVLPGTPGGTNAGNYTNWSIAATQIQFAVARAVAGGGETVWVTNGTYYLTNTLSIGNITLRSVHGRELTTINGNYPAYTNGCLYINGGSAVVTGFTIMNGFRTNSAFGEYYGGVKLESGTMRNCHITTNTAWSGGGVLVVGAVKIYDCIISSNSLIAGGGGAGMYLLAPGALISNCVFRGNVCTQRGGGMNMGSSGNLVINCSFISNTAGFGSGIYNNGSSIFRNCLLVGNTGVGAINFENSGIIQSSIIVGNIGIGPNLYDGGGRMENCIAVSNTLANNISGLGTNMNNCTYPNINNARSTGNITNDPAFANYPAGNYRLSANSPCINRGTNQDWMTNAVDLDGRGRIRYGTVDIGAYERINAGAIFSGR